MQLPRVKEIDAESLRARLEAGEPLRLLDIRSDREVLRGVLPQAEHLPMHELPLRMDELSTDQELVLYCLSGARSYHACTYLAQQGFDNVVNLRGGIIDWARNGFSLEPPLAN